MTAKHRKEIHEIRKKIYQEKFGKQNQDENYWKKNPQNQERKCKQIDDGKLPNSELMTK